MDFDFYCYLSTTECIYYDLKHHLMVSTEIKKNNTNSYFYSFLLKHNYTINSNLSTISITLNINFISHIS